MSRALGDQWPLPQIDDGNRGWFTSGELSVQKCLACGAFQHPPEDVCSSCQSFDLGVHLSTGLGRIESLVIVRHPPHTALVDVVPYAVVVVSLDDAPGVNVVGNLLGTPPEELRIGQAVSASFEEVPDPEGGETLRIPQWKLA